MVRKKELKVLLVVVSIYSTKMILVAFSSRVGNRLEF